MAKLPIFKRIQREDFPTAPAWVDKFIYPLNRFFEGVYNAMNGRLTFGDNVAGEFRSVDFTTLSTYDGTAANFDPIAFVHALKNKPKGLLLLQIQRFGLATYTPIEGDVYLDWIEENGTVQIGLIRGLTASTKYSLRVLLI